MALITLLALGGLGGGWFFLKSRGSTEQPAQQTQSQASSTLGTNNAQNQTALPEGTIRLVATGNFAAYDSINQVAKTDAGYDYSELMNDLEPLFDKADIGLCHQETIAAGTDEGVSGYPYFNAPVEWSEGLVGLGCNVINLASFHSYDKGQRALSKAIDFYDDKKSVQAVVGVNRSQEEQNKIRYIDVKGLTIGILAYTTKSQKEVDDKYGLNVYNADTAKKQVSEAKGKADFVIVGMTWGKEDSSEVDAEQEEIAQNLASAGADLVIGNGPHVLQTAKTFPGKDKGAQTLVFFSLGNAVNSQLPVDNLIGAIAVIDIDIPTQDMVSPGVLPVYQHYEWTAAQKASGNFNARTNFNLYMLDQAADAMGKSLNGTSVEAQTERVKEIMTKHIPIQILTSKDIDNLE